MLLFRFVAAIFPFVREMLFPGKSTKEILMENKLAVALAAMLACSVYLNYFMVKRVYEIAQERKAEHVHHADGRASDAAAAASAGIAAASAPVTPASDPAQDDLAQRLNALFGNKP
jgi:hypothetical protein